MMRVKELLNGGWSAEDNELSKDDIIRCFGCKKEVNEYDFFYCGQYEKSFCRECIEGGGNKRDLKHITYRNHTDWHIIKIEKTKNKEEKEEK